jgi:UDP-N-acetylmuramate--alanine ligase
VQALASRIPDRRRITYGFNPQSDLWAVNVQPEAGGSVFDLVLRSRGETDQTRWVGLQLPMAGRHNVQNSLAAIAVARELGGTEEQIRAALLRFGGVKRRFTRTGEWSGAQIFDDYGHHPVEIAAVLKAARASTTRQVIAVVQPHRYTRLHSLFADFCTCFNDADAVIVAPVYAAGEQPIDGASRDDLVAGIKASGHRNVQALDSKHALAGLVAGLAGEGDYVVCLGAGDITQWAYALPGELDKLSG